jgi:S-adenosylmethionine hydrolase
MPIVTLTTDWNKLDYYAGVVKGTILSKIDSAIVVDITHQIATFNFAQAAFVLKQAFIHFPKGSIHIIDVRSDYSETTPFVVVTAHGHFFIGTDNGIFSQMFEPEEMEGFVLQEPETDSSFVCFSVFSQAAIALMQGKTPAELGGKHPAFTRSVRMLPIEDHKSLSGHVIHIDSYGNAISNIDRKAFYDFVGDNAFVIQVQSKRNEVRVLSKYYNQGKNGDLLALFNSLGLLELAIRQGNVAELLNLDINSTLRVQVL